MNKNVYILIAVIIISVGLFLMSRKDPEMTTPVGPSEDTEMQIEESVETPDNSTVDTTGETGGEMEGIVAGSYETYSPEKLARAESGKVVLFFHASWCPTCRALNADIEKNLGAIPENLSILKTDYDAETELKQKYGVTYQHTLVQVDASGGMIKKWSGGTKLLNLLSQIN